VVGYNPKQPGRPSHCYHTYSNAARLPSLLRGDKGFGNEGIMREAERRALPYLFNLRLTANLKRALERLSDRAIGPIRAKVGKPKRPRFDCEAGADKGASWCCGGA